ncbi:MAG: type II/IV secretion system protein [Candidatus Berkelbacteria bacterium]
MDSQKKNSPIINSQFSGLYQALSSQSIIDVFVVQGLVLPADGEKIKSKYQNNLAIERFLLSNKLISREAINKAYSIILKLPFISLHNVAIPEDVKKVVPERLAKKFQVAAFAKKNQILNLAIANPGELFLPQNQTLESLVASKNLTLELFITTPEDLIQVLGRGKEAVSLDKGNLPVIFLRNRNVDQKVLQLLPLEFILKNRLVIFDKLGPKTFRIAQEDPYNAKTKQIIEYLKTNNNLELEEFSTSKDDIDYLISLYQKAAAGVVLDKPEVLEKKADGGAFSGLLESLVSDNKPGIASEESISKAVPMQTSKFGELSGPKKSSDQPASAQDEVRYELEATKKLENEEKDIGKLLGKDVKTVEELKEIASENSTPKFVAGIISFALTIGSSDIHVEPEAKRLRIRCRVDGILKDIFQLPPEYGPQIISRIKILAGMKLDETRIPQDGRFSVDFMEREVDVRVSMLPTVYGEKTVMRILDKTQGIRSLEDLGFVGSAFKIVMEQIKQPYGIIMSTGPTGSGKSTTLYAILNRLNQPGVNVVTLEDPVEYEVPGVNQCQIKPKIGFTFAEGLRSILRQDPNIIMVGEVRDADTASMATHAALTGHLVLTTLHTNDAASALPRLINMGVEPFLITSSINLIIAQRLLRRICPKCREKVEIPEALKQAIQKEVNSISKTNQDDIARVKELQFYKGRGCKECTEGYKGRVGIYELLVMDDQIENLAVSRRPASEIKDAAIAAGMLTMKQDGILKAIDGLTTIDEVLLATGEVGMGEAINAAKAQVAPKPAMPDCEPEEKKENIEPKVNNDKND